MLYFLCYCSCFKVLIPMRNLTFVRRYTARHRWARRHPVTSWTFSEPSALPTKMCSEGNVLRCSYLTLTLYRFVPTVRETRHKVAVLEPSTGSW